MHTTIQRNLLLPGLLVAMTGLLASCNAGTGDTPDAAAQTGATQSAQAPTQSSPSGQQEARIADTDFEGTMQQLMIMVSADAITEFAGSNELSAILALSPDEVIEAVNNGTLDAMSVEHSTIEIDEDMARVQTKGQLQYAIFDGGQLASHVVDPDSKMIMTMNPAKLAAASGKPIEPMQIDAEKVGEREIRGFDTTGYRFEFIGDNIMTSWLSEDLESEVGGIFDAMAATSPFGRIEIGDGAQVRGVMVNRAAIAGGGSYMPAYTITESYGLEPGDIDDARFVLPEGYQRRGMADLQHPMPAPPQP